MLKNLKEYLPSEGFRKRVLIIIGILVLGLGTWQVIKLAPWKKWGEGEIATLQPGTGQPGIVVSSLTESDQDNDGLPDWEERFWGTDPENPDSNGDGILDGIEINQKKTADGVSLDTAHLNETDIVAQRLAKTGFTVGQAGEVSEDGASLLGEKLLEDIKSIKKYQVYNRSIIKSRGTSNQAVINAYPDDIAKIMSNVKVGNDISVVIVGKALQDNTPEELKRLDPIITMYTKAVTAMINTPAPKGFEQIHLDILNAYARMRDETTSLKEAFTNPALATAAIYSSVERTDQLIKAYDAYIQKLQQYTGKAN